MELEAVTHAIQWLASQRNGQITHVIIFADSMILLQMVGFGMGCQTSADLLSWACWTQWECMGRWIVKNTRYHIWLQLGRAEVLRGLRNFPNMDRSKHHSIDRLKERGVEKGSGRHSTLRGRERSVFNQTNIDTVSRATLGRLLRDGTERVWAFPSATMPS